MLALVIARGLVASRRTAAPKRAMAVRAAGGVVALAAALGVTTSLAERWGGFVDISEEREHTLSSGTRAIVEALPVETGATLFWSADQEGIPFGHPDACADAPGPCSMRSRDRVAGGSSSASSIRAPTYRDRDRQPSGQECAGYR